MRYTQNNKEIFTEFTRIPFIFLYITKFIYLQTNKQTSKQTNKLMNEQTNK